MCREVVSGGWDHVSDSNQGVLWSFKPTFGISRSFLGAVSDASGGTWPSHRCFPLYLVVFGGS